MWRHLWNRPLSAESWDGRIAQYVCYGVALLVLTLGCRGLVRLEMTRAEVFLGVLLVLTVALLCVCLGTLTRIESELRRRR